MALFFAALLLAVQFLSNARCTLAKFTDHSLPLHRLFFFCGSRIDAAGNKRKYARIAHVVLVQEASPADVNDALIWKGDNDAGGEFKFLHWNRCSCLIGMERWQVICVTFHLFNSLVHCNYMWLFEYKVLRSSHLIKQLQELQLWFSEVEKNWQRMFNRNHWMGPF